MTQTQELVDLRIISAVDIYRDPQSLDGARNAFHRDFGSAEFETRLELE
jgi:hypothetical protein